MPLTSAHRRQSAALMRVNHAGEIAAQALYCGQALVARSAATRRQLDTAADEERDHLAWCAQRFEELGGRTSVLDPFWYAGSFCVGVLAGMRSDAVSLGFVAETESQVEAHLQDHLRRLPEGDSKSRAILLRMSEDEAHHGTMASLAGGAELPWLAPPRDGARRRFTAPNRLILVNWVTSTTAYDLRVSGELIKYSITSNRSLDLWKKPCAP